MSASRSRTLTIGITVCLAVFGYGTTALTAKPKFSNVAPQPITITAEPITLDQGDPAQLKPGSLIWRSGIVLKSQSSYLGGYSGLTLNRDGTHLLAVSDAGLWLSAGIEMRDGKIVGLKDTRTGSLKARNNKPLTSGRYRDAESIAPVRHGSLDQPLYIGFERLHRIGLFPVKSGQLAGPSRYLKVPSIIKQAEGNKGFEALALLNSGPHKGALLAFTEQFLNNDGDHRAWILKGGKTLALSLERLDDFDVTGAATLPGGDVLVLERRFSFSRGIAARVRRIVGKDIKPGARLKGKILLDLRGATQIDNMEGIAIHRSAKGQTIVTLISDDNFNPAFQRTLIMQFILRD